MHEETCFISFIVPIYNSEAFLNRCIDSLLKQTHCSYEVILVNDGSSDKSGEICSYYENTFANIKTYHIKNAGQSAARNYGMRKAIGEYIAFVDSDDFIALNYTAVVFEHLKDSDIDILNFNHNYVEKDSYYPVDSGLEKGRVLNNTEIKNYLYKAHETRVVWFVTRNVYRRAFINNFSLSFREDLRIGEDLIFNLEAFENAAKVFSIEYNLYYYHCNSESVTQKIYKPDLIQMLNRQYEAKISIFTKFNMLNEVIINDLYNNTKNHLVPMILANCFNAGRRNRMRCFHEAYDAYFITEMRKREQHTSLKFVNMTTTMTQFRISLFMNKHFNLLCISFIPNYVLYRFRSGFYTLKGRF